MSLRSSNEPGRYEFNAERVRFEMITDNEERVRCAITSYALRYLDRRMKESAKAQLHVFSTYRQAIETLAVKKYDRGRLDTDGGVLILQGDVPSSAKHPNRKRQNRGRLHPQKANGSILQKVRG